MCYTLYPSLSEFCLVSKLCPTSKELLNLIAPQLCDTPSWKSFIFKIWHFMVKIVNNMNFLFLKIIANYKQFTDKVSSILKFIFSMWSKIVKNIAKIVFFFFICMYSIHIYDLCCENFKNNNMIRFPFDRGSIKMYVKLFIRPIFENLKWIHNFMCHPFMILSHFYLGFLNKNN